MSKHIELFSDNQASKHHSHLEEHRPDKLSLSTLQPIANPKWAECKVLGKNILIRSYASACVCDDELYIYGGLQILTGILSDFHRINLNPSNGKFEWHEVPLKAGSLTPGPRAKHSMVHYKRKIYLFGGISSSTEYSNTMFCYDIASQNWQELHPKNQPMPFLDSFGCVLVGSKVVMLCGYNGVKGQFLNSVYEYDIDSNTLTVLYAEAEGDKSKSIFRIYAGPIPRANCSAASDGADAIYLFGGNQSDNRLNDLWRFDLSSKHYSQVEDKEDLRPVVRSGHTVNFYDGKLYIFGGIHEVTWELDDLHIYDLKTHEWTTLEVDSARRRDTINQSKQLLDAKKEVSPTRKKEEKYWHDTVTSNISHNKSAANPPHHKNPSGHFEELEHNGGSVSPGKMIDEQKRKQFMHRKAEMLKEFNVPEKQKGRYISVEPTTQAIRNSLDIIGNSYIDVGNPNPRAKHPGKLTEFGKETCSKFLQPLANNVNLIVGRKPCARDGHNTVVLGQALIIFGGDRHQMSFNDIFRLDMNIVTKQFQH